MHMDLVLQAHKGRNGAKQCYEMIHTQMKVQRNEAFLPYIHFLKFSPFFLPFSPHHLLSAPFPFFFPPTDHLCPLASSCGGRTPKVAPGFNGWRKSGGISPPRYGFPFPIASLASVGSPASPGSWGSCNKRTFIDKSVLESWEFQWRELPRNLVGW